MAEHVPAVTLGVPVYNGEDYLAQSLASVLAQDFTDLEILIWDNASTDGTEQIAREAAAADERITYHRNDRNVGGAVNSNLLLGAARAPLFKWAYHDDIMAPTFVSRAVEILDEGGPDVVLAYPRIHLIDAAGTVVGGHGDENLQLDGPAPASRVKALLRGDVTQTQFGLMRTEVALAGGGVSCDVAGELVLPLALALRGRLALIPEQLLSIRQHEQRAGGHRDSEAAWVNPDRPHVVFPYSRATPLFLRAVLDAPLTSRDRRACVAAVLGSYTLTHARSIVGDVVRLPWDAGWIR